jgi:hypothetical protein
MAQVTRVYGTPAEAEKAVAALRAEGFYPESIEVVHAPAAGAADSTAEDIETALYDAGVPRAELKHCAARLRQGGSLVTVDAPYGRGALAEEILADSHAGPHGHQATHRPRQAPVDDDNPAPFSDALGMKLLVNDEGPFSSSLGLPLLTKKQTPSTKLIGEPAPFSRLLFLPTLWR